MALFENTTNPYEAHEASEHDINASNDSLESQRRALQDFFQIKSLNHTLAAVLYRK